MFRLAQSLRPIHLVQYVCRSRISRPLLLLQIVQVPLRSIHTSNGSCEDLKLSTMPRLRDAEILVNDLTLQDRFLEEVSSREFQESSESQDSLNTVFVNAIDLASGDNPEGAYEFVVQMWGMVFLTGHNNRELQKKFLNSKLKVVHLMLNRGFYLDYMSMVEPIYKIKHLEAKRSWADTLFSVIQLSREQGSLTYNKLSIVTYLKGRLTLEEKRQLLTVFVRKCLLYSEAPHMDMPNVLAHFLEFLEIVGDGHLILNTTDLLVYEKALRLIAMKDTNPLDLEVIEIAVMTGTANRTLASNFLSSLLSAVCTSDPATAVVIWKYKCENFDIEKFCTWEDLRNVMQALFTLKAYDQVYEVHKTYPSLHNDNQIEILLNINEKKKNWKLLQKQFEDMYGRNQLPHVIHYTIVMNALASLGVLTEVEQLYHQLRARNLQPNAAIYAALIKSNINTGNNEAASEWYRNFLNEVEEGNIDPDSVASILLQMITANFIESNTGDTLLAFQKILKTQELSSLRFISSDLIKEMLKFVTSVYRKQEFHQIFDFARKYQLLDEEVYYRAIMSLTKFGEFEKADELAFEAHVESKVPFSSALITKAQLRNFRAWLKASTTQNTRKFLVDRINTILQRVNRDTISPRNLPVLMEEVIRHNLSWRKVQIARQGFERVKQMNGLSEEHFLPFLHYYAGLNTHNGYSKILEEYREMAKLKITISARTYLYLIQALLRIDKANNTGFHNSYKLLESVFALYGYKTNSETESSTVVLQDLAKNAPTLLKIVAEYSIATIGQNDDSMDFIVGFLNQIKKRLGKRIPFELRMAILHQMGRIYMSRGDMTIANELISNGILEIHAIVDNDPTVLSKQLSLEYRKLVALQLLTIKYKMKKDRQALDIMLSDSLLRNIRLSGNQYNEISLEILSKPTNIELLNHILEACERYLVSANWAEFSVRRRIRAIYQLYVMYLINTFSEETVSSKYSILNQYYDTTDLEKVRQKFQDVKRPLDEMSKLLQSYNAMCSTHVTVDDILTKTAEFFVPERVTPTQNIMGPVLSSNLVRCIEGYCDGDRTLAFTLYDLYPDTIEYLLLFIEERIRIVQFRIQVDRISPPPKRSNEERSSKRDRALQALDFLNLN